MTSRSDLVAAQAAGTVAPTRSSLYQLAQQYRELAERLADTQEDPQAVLDTLEGELWPIEVKTRALSYVLANLNYLVEAGRDAERQVAALRKARERRIERLKDYLQTCMEVAGITKVECPEFQAAIRKNPPKVVIDDEALVPHPYWRQPEPEPPVLDKERIKEDIKAGLDVPGAHLEQTTRLEVK